MLHDVGYEDAGKLRPIMHRMSLVSALLHWPGMQQKTRALPGT